MYPSVIITETWKFHNYVSVKDTKYLVAKGVLILGINVGKAIRISREGKKSCNGSDKYSFRMEDFWRKSNEILIILWALIIPCPY